MANLKLVYSMYRALKLNELNAWRRNRGITRDDLIIGCYVRSGSTWLQNMIYELLTGMIPDHDQLRVEMPYLVDKRPDTPKLWKNQGRVIKSHMVYHSSYKNGISIIRDPRRVAISEFKYRNAYRDFPLTFDQFIDRFTRGRHNGGMTWKDHIRSWNRAKEAGNAAIHLVRFEDLKQDPLAEMRKVTEFLGITVTDNQIESAIENSSIENMRKREIASERTKLYKSDNVRIVNDGKTGDWSEELSEAHRIQIETTFASEMKLMNYL